MKKRTPLEKLAFTFEPNESVPKPGVADGIVGRQRIGEMTPDEYLKLATAAQRAIAEKAVGLAPAKKLHRAAGRIKLESASRPDTFGRHAVCFPGRQIAYLLPNLGLPFFWYDNERGRHRIP